MYFLLKFWRKKKEKPKALSTGKQLGCIFGQYVRYYEYYQFWEWVLILIKEFNQTPDRIPHWLF